MLRTIATIALVLGLFVQTAIAKETDPKSVTSGKLSSRTEQSIQVEIEKSMRSFLRSYMPRILDRNESMEVRFIIGPDGSVKAAPKQSGLAQTTARMIERMITFKPAVGSTTVLLKIYHSHYKLVKVQM